MNIKFMINRQFRKLARHACGFLDTGHHGYSNICSHPHRCGKYCSAKTCPEIPAMQVIENDLQKKEVLN